MGSGARLASALIRLSVVPTTGSGAREDREWVASVSHVSIHPRQVGGECLGGL